MQTLGSATIVCSLIFASCSKVRPEQTPQPGVLTTVANDIQFNQTSVSLSAATKTALDFLKYNGNTYNWAIMSIHEPLGTNNAGLDEDGRFVHDIGLTTIPSSAITGQHQLTSYANQVNGSGGSSSDQADIPAAFRQWGYATSQNT